MIIRWIDKQDRTRQDSLFAIFAALSRGEVMSFPALRPHQRVPWHCYCVQVAAMALNRASLLAPPEEEAAWHDLLMELTPDWPSGEAWELVVDDWSRPALLQPPMVSSANRADYKNVIKTPDALDMLVTSKNHDLKAARMQDAGEEDWLFALVALQTNEGFMGVGNFGISRMNGGFGSRMAFAIRPEGGIGTWFLRDLERIMDAAEPQPTGSNGLLWLEPWDGVRQLDFAMLSPLYVDICRRVRLSYGKYGIVAYAAGSKVARVAASSLNGRTGDPWAPLAADGSKSITPTGMGFGYRQIAKLMDRREVEAPRLARIGRKDAAEGLAIEATAVVRGQGKTEGFHSRSCSPSAPMAQI